MPWRTVATGIHGAVSIRLLVIDTLSHPFLGSIAGGWVRIVTKPVPLIGRT
jgi:hypothetical protein